jgi:polysaccharide export outer membrane protein
LNHWKQRSVALESALEGVIMLKCLPQKINLAALVLGLLAGCAVLAGCQSPEPVFQPPPVPNHDTNGAPASPTASAAPTTLVQDKSLKLREGNTLKIAFPGAPTLDTVQQIRQDGKITMDMVGEVKAAGLTPTELEKELLRVYASQLVTKEVTVTVQSAVFEVYVTGAVLRPGKITTERVETPLEAIIEAGIDHNKANLKKVVVVREGEGGKSERFELNLDAVLKGKESKPFILKPMDKIYVPEKFMWY